MDYRLKGVPVSAPLITRGNIVVDGASTGWVEQRALEVAKTRHPATNPAFNKLKAGEGGNPSALPAYAGTEQIASAASPVFKNKELFDFTRKFHWD